jgi:hypothetical protein
MGTQISKGSGLLDQQIARREEVTKLRRQKDAAIKLEVAAEKKTQRALEKELSKETAVAGAPDIDRFEARKLAEESVNQKQKIQERERVTIERERVEANRGPEVKAADAVLEAYGLNDAMAVIAQNKQRQAELAEEKAVGLERKAALEGEKAAGVERKAALESERKVADADRQAQLDQLLADRLEDMKGIDGDVSRIAEALGVANDAEVIMLDIKKDLEKTSQATDIENAAKAKVSAEAVLASQQKLKDALASDQFTRKQKAEIRLEDKRAEIKDSADEPKTVVPQSTLGLVPRQEEPKDTRPDVLDLVGPPDAKEFQLIDPQALKFGNDREVETSKALVAEAIEKADVLDSSVKELAMEAKKRAKQVVEKVRFEVPSPRLNTSADAARAAEEAVRITVEDPQRALQSQAAFSVDTVLRVLG